MQLTMPAAIVVEPVSLGSLTIRCTELDAAGRPVGELEIGVFAGAMVIDRDGILEDKAVAAGRAALAGQRVEVSATFPLRLPGAAGIGANVSVRVPADHLRYATVMALASHDYAIDGGVLVVCRCARPEWPAAEEILRSLRILTRKGIAEVANDEVSGSRPLPLPLLR